MVRVLVLLTRSCFVNVPSFGNFFGSNFDFSLVVGTWVSNFFYPLMLEETPLNPSFFFLFFFALSSNEKHPITLWQSTMKQIWVGTNVFGQLTYFCGLCGYTSSNSSHVKRHFLVHTGERPFVCNICGRAFNLKWNLKSHYLAVHQTAVML
jgi:uncharacterized Zn-finger protein